MFGKCLIDKKTVCLKPPDISRKRIFFNTKYFFYKTGHQSYLIILETTNVVLQREPGAEGQSGQDIC